MARHRIGLSAAWEVRKGGDRLLWTRRFGRPGGLEAADRVFLVLERSAAGSRLLLNGQSLADPPAGATRVEWEITPHLRDRNELVVVPAAAVDGPPGRSPLPPLLGIVSVEIESSLEPGPQKTDSIA